MQDLKEASLSVHMKYHVSVDLSGWLIRLASLPPVSVRRSRTRLETPAGETQDTGI